MVSLAIGHPVCRRDLLRSADGAFRHNERPRVTARFTSGTAFSRFPGDSLLVVRLRRRIWHIFDPDGTLSRRARPAAPDC